MPNPDAQPDNQAILMSELSGLETNTDDVESMLELITKYLILIMEKLEIKY
jgi:archaellum component FlaC